MKNMSTTSPLQRQLGLPVIQSADDLARHLGISQSILIRYASVSTKYYKTYRIPKKSGGTRIINAPNRSLKGIQAWVLRNILDKISPSEHATAYRMGRNTLHNVKPHRDNSYCLCFDIEDFFPSVKIGRVCAFFRLFGYSQEVSRCLALLCTCRGSLPQGAVTSPALSNLVVGRLDARIAGYCRKRNIAYTRYADDICLSSNNRKTLFSSVPIVLLILSSEGFSENKSKRRYMGPSKRCQVTGLVRAIEQSRFGIGHYKLRQFRAVLHHFELGLPLSGDYLNIDSINGWMAHLKSVDGTRYWKLLDYWNKLKH